MSRRTYTDFNTNLILRCANRTDITADMRAQSFRAAYLWCARSFKHSQLQLTCLETIGAGSDTLTPLATDIWEPYVVINTTNARAIDPGDLVEIERVTKQTGIPGKYHWWGGVFYFDRKPAANTGLKIFYNRKPVEISGGTGSELDEMFDQAIEIKAAQFCLELVRDYDEAAKQEMGLRSYLTGIGIKLPVDQEKLNDKNTWIRVRKI